MRDGITFCLSQADRQRLSDIAAAPLSLHKHVWRARIVRLSSNGLGTWAIMAATGKSKTCVWRWQERFMHDGVDGLLRDKSRPPGKAPVPPKRVAQIVRLTQETPPDEATHWTARAMAKAVGLAVSTVQSIWKAHGLAPHRWRSFKLSNDPAETPPSPLSPPQASTRFERRSSFGSGLRSGMPFFSSFSISCTALVVGTDAATQALLTDIGLAPLPAKQKSMSRSPGGGVSKVDRVAEIAVAQTGCASAGRRQDGRHWPMSSSMRTSLPR